MSRAIIFINWYALFAKRLDAQLVALRILSENETEAEGEQNLRLFVENSQRENLNP